MPNPVEEVDPETLEAAKEYPRLLPQEMVPTPFTEPGEDLRTTGSIEMTPVDEASLELQSIAATTPTTFSYAWEPAGSSHVFYRDGATIGTSDDAELQDTALAPETTYMYQIDSYEGDAIVSTQYVPVTTPAEGAATSAVRSDAAAASYQQYVSQAIYRTFITDNRVSLGFFETMGCGQAFAANRSFGGDNRGFTTPPLSAPYDSTSSRTSVALNVNWDNPAPYDLIWVKAIGTTRLYEGSTLIDSRTASDSGIVISEAYASSAYAQARVNHSVGNPYCVAGAIQYNVVFRWYRNGTFEVVGWRQPVPHHEIYGGWDIGGGSLYWGILGRFTNEGFPCLTGSCGTRTVNISRTV